MKVEITEYADVLSFSAHLENGTLVIDECEGISPQDAIALFPDWVIESITSQTNEPASD